MKIRNTIAVAALALGFNAETFGASQCMPCPAGKFSNDNAVGVGACFPCPEDNYCISGNKVPCIGGQRAHKGSAQCLDVESYVNSFRKPEDGGTKIAQAAQGNCVIGTLSSGVYVVILNGGNGGHSGRNGTYSASGGNLKFRFYLPPAEVNAGNKLFQLCYGSNGGNSSDHGSGGGAGSWLAIGRYHPQAPGRLVVGYYFAAGGGGGAGEFRGSYAGGGGGGGIGAGGGGSDSPNGDCSAAGGSIASFSTQGQCCKRSCGGGYGSGLINNGKGGAGYGSGGGGGAGGGNGGAGGNGYTQTSESSTTTYAGGAPNISQFSILDKFGRAGTSSATLGGKGGNFKQNGSSGLTSHTSNESTTISAGVQLYKLAPPA
jgi:hypothetical protein